jgi:hypothetical protein
MPIAWFWWCARKKRLLKISSPDYVREKLTREWEMLRKLATEPRKEIARQVAKAGWDEKRREEP